MVSACVEIETTRDIAHQIVRHRSFSYQEFSQRYAEATNFELRETRLQDTTNRQSSLLNEDRELDDMWKKAQADLIDHATKVYKWALSEGIAKEVARAVLPEGNTTTRLYMTGTLRSWIHYLNVRLDYSTQKEHREVAVAIYKALQQHYPNILEMINEIE
jgi:thymidylate synthase (FAD)